MPGTPYQDSMTSFDCTIFEATRGKRFVLLPNLPHYSICAVSRDMCQHLGLPKEALLGKNVSEVFPMPPQDPEGWGQKNLLASLSHALQHKVEHRMEPVRYDVPTPTGGNKRIYWNSYNLPVLNEAGDVAYLIHTTEEATWQPQTDENKLYTPAGLALTEKEKAFGRLFDQVPFAIAIFRGLDFSIELVNEACLKIWGQTEEDVLGKPLFDILPKATEPKLKEALTEVWRTGKSYQTIEYLAGSDQAKRVCFNFLYEALREPDGSINAVSMIATDITDQVLALQTWEESVQETKALLESAPFPICVNVGENMLIQQANQAMLDAWGKGPGVIGSTLKEVLPESSYKAVYANYKQVLDTGIPFHRQNERFDLTIDGITQTYYFNYSFTPLYDWEGKVYGVVNSAANVTDLNVAHKQIADAEASLRNAIDIAELGTWKYEVASRLMTYSPRMIEWYGLDDKTVNYEYIMDYMHQDDRPRHTHYLNHVFDWQEDDTITDVHTVINRKTGRAYIIQSIGKAIRDAEGTLLGIEGMSRDVTKEHNNRQALESEVHQRTEQLATAIENLQTVNSELQRSNANLEEFAYAASHDLKEPVRKISIFMGRLKAQLRGKLAPEDTYMLSRVEDASKRMNALIDDLLLYSHINYRSHETERVDLNEKVKRVIEDLELDIEHKKARIVVEELPVVEGYGRQLQQLFQNLLSNALKYTHADVSPVVSIQARVVRGGTDDLPATKDYHVITIRDNGIGFEQAYTEKIFQMFKRLHGNHEYEGTGLGLSIAKKVVENHQGRIVANSIPGQGAIFEIYLPVS